MSRHVEKTSHDAEVARFPAADSPDLVKIAASRPGRAAVEIETQATYADLYQQHSRNQHEQGLDLIRDVEPCQDEVALDIGCGTGALSVVLAEGVGPTGLVLGVDPDSARLALARAQRPAALKNLHYVVGRGEDLFWVPDNSLDLVYSNYVLHWVEDKGRVIDEAFRCLRPGGRISFELPGPLAPIFVKLRQECQGSNRDVFDRVMTLRALEWRDVMESHGFTVEKAAYVPVRVFYPSIEAFFDWWEATTHGAFQRSDLSADGRDRLAAYVSGGREVLAQCVRVLARKPSC